MKSSRTNLLSTSRLSESFALANPSIFKRQVIEWIDGFEQCCYYDHNSYQGYRHKSYDVLAAAGMESELVSTEEEGAFDKLKNYCSEKKDWLFGHLSYDLKNDVEHLTSANFDGIGFPPLQFFQPTYVFEIKGNWVTIHSKSESPFHIFQTILQISISKNRKCKNYRPAKLLSRISKNNYLQTVQAIRQHISLGEIYEMNFCQEFYLEDFLLDEKGTFLQLNQTTKAPFSAFYKRKSHYLISSSPEGFLRKVGNRLISQPIKGTIKRGETPREDKHLQNQLLNSQKDRSENVMIVDLVRNDLSKSCIAGSVHVPELFGVKTFAQVHHLVSTVVGELREDIHFVDAIRNAFPMGSMTGTPKVRSMELIEMYEQTKRGLYAGAVGYCTPEGGFDFNVVIRSIIYNKTEKYLSTQVGGAIVYDSEPESEFNECLLKAKGMFYVLSGS